MSGSNKREQRYELKSVIEHIGKSTSEGHYIAYTWDQDCWTEWNDEISRIISWEEVKNKQAYLLFWERIDDGANYNCESKDVQNEIAFRETEVENKGAGKKWNSNPIKKTVQTVEPQEEGAFKMDVDGQSNKRRREEDENLMGEEANRRMEKRVEKRQKMHVHSEKSKGKNGRKANKSEMRLKKKKYTEIEMKN